MNRIVFFNQEVLIEEQEIQQINVEKRTVSRFQERDGGPMIRTEYRTSPTVQSYLMKAVNGELYRFTRSSKHSLRDDYPVVVRGVIRKGVRANEPLPQEVGIKPHRETAEFVEIEFADGKREEVSFKLTILPPSIENEYRRIAEMTIREATEALLDQFPNLKNKVLHAGILHMKGGQTWDQMQKAVGVGRGTLSAHINTFYEETRFPKPDRRKGKGSRVQFDDTRDLPEYYGTKKGGRIEPHSEQFDFPE